MAPVNKEQLVQSAEKNVARGKLDLAIKEYERVLEESPRDASTLNRIGDLWLRLNKVEGDDGDLVVLGRLDVGTAKGGLLGTPATGGSAKPTGGRPKPKAH